MEGKLYLDSISFHYEHNLIQPTFHSLDFTVEEYFMLWTGDIEKLEYTFQKPDKTYRRSIDLYSKAYKNDTDFWAEYQLIKSHPLNGNLKIQLEVKETLEEQFEYNGRK